MTERIFPTDANGNPLGPARDEVVRCRDCLHFDSYGNTFGWCALHDIDGSERRFCAWGERADA